MKIKVRFSFLQVHYFRLYKIFAAPLKSFKYSIDIKINASRDVVIERLRDLIHGQKFPTCVKKGIKISGVGITTGKRSLRDVITFYPH